MHLRYRAKHLRPRPRRRGPIVLVTAAAVSASAPAARGATHVVKRGESLSGIARRYGTSITRLVRLNDLSNPNVIVAGRRLRVPGPVAVASIHVIGRGETLSAIAARYETSVARLARINRIDNPNLIVAGTRLRVPAGGSDVVAHGARRPAKTDHVEANLERLAASHGVDVPLAKAVAWQESGWHQDVVSRAGAIGVMQVMPGTARFVNRVLDGGHLDIHDAGQNIHLGVMYLRHMLDRFGSEQRALAGYYSGPGNVGWKLKPYQKRYVASVLALKRRFS